MTKAEMITQFNFYTRKRNEYADKIDENNRVKQLLEEGLRSCNSSMQKLSDVADKSSLFATLYEKDESYFNDTEISGMIDSLDSLNTHLQNVHDSAQQQINVWYKKIQEYDED